MNRLQPTEIVNMCMIVSDGQVLVQDKVNAEWGGITFPGGHVEPYEPFVDAVIREVFEETGLMIEAPVLCGVKDWVNEDGSRYLVLCYKTDRFRGEVTSSAEGDVFWMPIEELRKPNDRFAPNMYEMFQVFLEDSFSEFYCCLENGKWQYELK